MDKSIYTGELFGEKISIQRISKAKAKKMFVDGQTIYLQSSNMHPFGVWQPCFENKPDAEDWRSYGEQFDTIINGFSYYNCDNERGNYIHFYAKVN